MTNHARRRDNSDLLTIVTAATGALWLTIPLVYGFCLECADIWSRGRASA